MDETYGNFFLFRMEETLAESSQDMKPEQSWISERLETVAVFTNTGNVSFFSSSKVVVYLEEHRQNIFYLVLFYLITFALFIERFMHFSFMSEHTDLRKIMGVSVTE